MKKCTECGESKELSHFYQRCRDGLNVIESKCKYCWEEHRKNYAKTPDGVTAVMNGNQRAASVKRGHAIPNYTLEDLREWVYSQPNWNTLYNNWVESGYDIQEKPSCDRNNDFLPYTLDNLTLMTWRENREKSSADRKSGTDLRTCSSIIGTCVETGVETLFHSKREADRNGFTRQNINACLNGKKKTSGGHTWRYA